MGQPEMKRSRTTCYSVNEWYSNYSLTNKMWTHLQGNLLNLRMHLVFEGKFVHRCKHCLLHLKWNKRKRKETVHNIDPDGEWKKKVPTKKPAKRGNFVVYMVTGVCTNMRSFSRLSTCLVHFASNTYYLTA